MATEKKKNTMEVPARVQEQLRECSMAIYQANVLIAEAESTLKSVNNVNGDYAFGPGLETLEAEGEDSVAVPQPIQQRVVKLAQEIEFQRNRQQLIVDVLLESLGVADTHDVTRDGSQLVPKEAPDA